MSKTKEQIEQEEKELAERAKKMAETIKAELGLDELKKDIVDLVDEKMNSHSRKNVLEVFVSEDAKKSIDELTKEEKCQAFAQALFRSDTAVLKALSEGVNADGGFTVPQDFYNLLLEEIEEEATMRSRVNVVPMKTNVLTLTMIAHGPQVYWTAEGVAKTTTTADFSQPTLTAYKMAAIIYLTDELVDDSAFNLVDVLVRRFAQAIAAEEDKVIVNGAGTTQPTGIFVNTSVATVTCTPAGLGFDDIISLINSLPVKFRAKASFIVHPNIVGELRKLKDSDGRYLWQDPMSATQPLTLHGYPVIQNYWAPVGQIAFGDYKTGYWLGDRQKITVKISNDTETTFTQDKTAVRVVERIAGDVVFTNAIRKLISIP